jgi:hypothetical protein
MLPNPHQFFVPCSAVSVFILFNSLLFYPLYE